MIRKKRPYWSPGELIVIGTFTGLIKVSSMLIALAGGGMNPVTLVLKNIVATSLLIILVYKVRKFGVLTLFAVINSVVSMILMGGNPMTSGGVLAAGMLCDCLIAVTGGYQRPVCLILGVGTFDLFSRAISLGYSFLMYREDTGLFVVGAIVVSVGYIGCLIGLGTGIFFAKELRHAGIIRE